MRPKPNSEGFTILEVILVLVFISIFAVVAVVRQPATDVSLKARAEVFKTHLRYAQTRAMSTDSGWGIEYNADSASYWLFKQGAANRSLFPGESGDAVDLAPSGISIASGSFRLIFDRWGRPDTAEGASTLVFDQRKASVSFIKAGESRPVTIVQNTGFIE